MRFVIAFLSIVSFIATPFAEGTETPNVSIAAADSAIAARPNVGLAARLPSTAYHSFSLQEAAAALSPEAKARLAYNQSTALATGDRRLSPQASLIVSPSQSVVRNGQPYDYVRRPVEVSSSEVTSAARRLSVVPKRPPLGQSVSGPALVSRALAGQSGEHDLRPLLQRLMQMRQKPGRGSYLPAKSAVTTGQRGALPQPIATSSATLNPADVGIGSIHENQAYIGINDWWDYQEDTIPGVGRYMVNVAIQRNLLIQADDMAIPNRGVELAFRRTYNEQERTSSLYGNGWTNSFNAYLQLNTDPQGNYVMSVHDVDGARYDYPVSGSNCQAVPGPCKFNRPPGQHAILAWDGNDGFFWTKKSGTTYYFNAPYLFMQNPAMGGLSGLLTAIWGRNHNNQLTFAYSFDGGNASSTKYLNTMTVTADATSPGVGRQAVLHYAQYGTHRLLSQLVWPNGTSVGYAYDANANLVEADEPPNGSSYATCLAVSPCRPQQYSYLTADGQMGAVLTPRWVASAGADGLEVKITPDQTGGIAALTYIGNANPTVPDGTNAGPLQLGYASGVSAYRTIAVTQGTGQTNWMDSDGHQTIYSWDSSGRVGARQENSGTRLLTSTFTYDADNNPITTVEPRGNLAGGNPYAFETDFAYDQNGNTVRVAKPTLANADGTFRPTSLYSYDANNNITAFCDPVQSHRLGKDAPAAPAAAPAPTDALCPLQAGSTIMAWLPTPAEPFGELQTITFPLGNHQSYLYNPAGQSGVDFGLPTQVTTDAFQQLDASTITPAQSFSYNFYGDLTAYSKGFGNWLLAYDTVGRLTSVLDPDNVQIETKAYFADGSTQTDQNAAERAGGVGTLYAYNLDGAETSEVKHFGCTTAAACIPGVTQKWYDGEDRLVEVQTPSSPFVDGGQLELTRYFYDLSKGSAALTVGGSSGFAAHGGLYKTQEYVAATVATPSWNDISGNAFDALDRVVAKFSYGGTSGIQAKITTYDAALNSYGYVSSTVNPLGEQTAYAYDAAGSATGVAFSGDGGVTPARSTVYDEDGRANSITSSLYGTQTYDYDQDGRVIDSKEPTLGGVTVASTLYFDYYPNGWRKDVRILAGPAPISGPQTLLTYTYRADSRQSKVSMPPYAQSLAWSYTNAGRLAARTDSYLGKKVSAENIPIVADSYAYDPFGRIATHVFPSGSYFNALTYDFEGEKTSLTATLAASFPSLVEPKSASLTYGYTNRGEFVGIGVNGHAGDGQKLIRGYPCETVTTPGLQCGVNPFNGSVVRTTQPIKCGAGFPTPHNAVNTYAYDAAGRRTLENDTSYDQDCTPTTAAVNMTYDAEDHTISNTDAAGAGQAVAWGPNGHPILVKAVGPSSPSILSLHWAGDELLFTSDASSKLSTFEVGDDEEITQFGGVTTTIIHTRDESGTVLLDHNGGAISTWNVGPTYYNPKGFLVGSGQLAGSGTIDTTHALRSRTDGYTFNNITFQGVRAFDPGTGQWTTPDAYQGEIDDPIAQKPYVWNRNNPIAYSDPSGFCIEDACIGEAALVGVAATEIEENAPALEAEAVTLAESVQSLAGKVQPNVVTVITGAQTKLGNFAEQFIRPGPQKVPGGTPGILRDELKQGLDRPPHLEKATGMITGLTNLLRKSGSQLTAHQREAAEKMLSTLRNATIQRIPK